MLSLESNRRNGTTLTRRNHDDCTALRQNRCRIGVVGMRHAAGVRARRRSDRRHHYRLVRCGVAGSDGHAVQPARQHRRQPGSRRRRTRRISIPPARPGRLHREGGDRGIPRRDAGEHRRERGCHRARRSQARDRHAAGRRHGHRRIAPARYDLRAEADSAVA